MPIPIDQLIQSYLDWLKLSSQNHLIGNLVVHLSASLEAKPAHGIFPISSSYSQVVVAEGGADALNNDTIIGTEWQTYTAHDNFKSDTKFRSDVTINKAGLLTVQNKIQMKPVGGMPPKKVLALAAGTGLVITAIENAITYTLSFRKFVFDPAQST